MLLSTLAVYVELAREDEQNRIGDPAHNLVTEIRLIEELGIYHLLCNLQNTYYSRHMVWEPTYAHELVDPGCRSLHEMAPVDNRNYFVFYVLERLLHNLSHQFQIVEDSRRKKWRHKFYYSKYGFRYD